MVPPTTGTNTSNIFYNGGDDDFDGNMVIILVALVCALICALCLNSIARCALRWTERAAAPPGIGKEALRRIPVAAYRPGTRVPAIEECAICLGELVEGEKVRVMPRCNHGFHVGCIDRWLGLHSSCPVCRRPLVEPCASVSVEIR